MPQKTGERTRLIRKSPFVILSEAKDLQHEIYISSAHLLCDECREMEKRYYVYIATNKRNTVFYTGVTNDLSRRMQEHLQRSFLGFTAKYNVAKLVWMECFSSPAEAIAMEKKIKGWRRSKKIELIKAINPQFLNLSKL